MPRDNISRFDTHAWVLPCVQQRALLAAKAGTDNEYLPCDFKQDILIQVARLSIGWRVQKPGILAAYRRKAFDESASDGKTRSTGRLQTGPRRKHLFSDLTESICKSPC